MLHVSLAGGLKLEHDGVPLELPRSRRARALLAWLALNPGSHPRASVAARFWPDVLDESARTSLRAALSELRQALGGDARALVATRDAVGLNPAAVRVDVLQAESAEDLAGLEAPLLAGFDDEWATEAREAHARRVAEALEVLAARAQAAGDGVSAVALSRRVVAVDPLAEEPVRALMRRLAAGGRRAEAIGEYRRLAGRLRDRLGVAPSRQTRALAEELRGEERAERLPLPGACERAEPFAGRARELARLDRMLEHARSRGVRGLALVSGEPGVGKTTLALRFLRSAYDAGADVAIGRCWEEPLTSYGPFAEILRHAAAHAATPDLDAVIAECGGDRARLLDSLDETLTDLAASRPLVLLVDDLHWADGPTLLALRALLLSGRRAPVLVVATFRETELGRRNPLTGALGDLRPAERIELRGLQEGEIAELSASVLGRPEIAADLKERTGGNALFVEEVLRALARGDRTAVPESVRHAVTTRLSRLTREAEELLEIAAVLGPEVDPHLLAALAGEASHGDALDDLLRAALLRPADGRLAFPHTLIRDAVYADVNPLRRARLHLLAAEELTRRGEERHIEQIAHQLAQAASPAHAERTAAMLARAGEQATTRLAYEEAASWFERAHQALEMAGSASTELAVRRAEALARAGQVTAARRTFLDASARARAEGDGALLARVALGAGGVGTAIAAVDEEIVELLEVALQAIGEGDPATRSRLLSRLAVELFYLPSRARSEALAGEAVELARATGDADALSSALNAQHVVMWRPDRVRERLAISDEMAALGDPEADLQARNWRVTDLWEAGDLEAWSAAVARHDELADELRLPAFQWYRPLWASVDAVRRGAHDEADRLREAALAAGTRAEDRNAELFVLMARFNAENARGEFQPWALEYLERQIPRTPVPMSWRSAYAWYLAALGRAAEAREQLWTVLAEDLAALPFDMNWPSAMSECSDAAILLGDAEAAVLLYPRLAPYAGRPLTAGRSVATYGAADRVLAGLAALLGRGGDAERHLAAAREHNARMGLAGWLERTEDTARAAGLA